MHTSFSQHVNAIYMMYIWYDNIILLEVQPLVQPLTLSVFQSLLEKRVCFDFRKNSSILVTTIFLAINPYHYINIPNFYDFFLIFPYFLFFHKAYFPSKNSHKSSYNQFTPFLSITNHKIISQSSHNFSIIFLTLIIFFFLFP